MRHNKRCNKCQRFITLTEYETCWNCFIKGLDASVNTQLLKFEKGKTRFIPNESGWDVKRGVEPLNPFPTFNAPTSAGLLQIFTFFVLAVALAGGILWVIFNVKF